MTTKNELFATNFLATPVDEKLSALPDGGLVVGSWLDSMVARGFGWTVTVGDFTTPIQGGGAGLIIDQNQPELAIGIPSGTTMRPVRFHIAAEAPLIVTDNDESEILIAVDRTQFLATDGTFTVEAPLNMRTDIISGSPLTVNSAYTGDVTNPTLSMELARKIMVADIVGAGGTTTTWGDLDLVYEPKHPPFIVGPAIFLVYWGGTVATSAFLQGQYVAFPSSKVTSLV